MKQVKIVIPQAQDMSASLWMFNNNVRVLLTYSKDDFFDSKIVIICAVPDEALTAFTEQFKIYMK